MANYSTLHRRPWETSLTPFCRATTYARIQDGTYPPPVKIGRMSAWLDREMEAVNEALIQGAKFASSSQTWSPSARRGRNE